MAERLSTINVIGLAIILASLSLLVFATGLPRFGLSEYVPTILKTYVLFYFFDVRDVYILCFAVMLLVSFVFRFDLLIGDTNIR